MTFRHLVGILHCLSIHIKTHCFDNRWSWPCVSDCYADGWFVRIIVDFKIHMGLRREDQTLAGFTTLIQKNNGAEDRSVDCDEDRDHRAYAP
jgi:hypothetical protein